MRLYTPLLLAWAGRQGFHPADAEDLAQEVLVKLLRLLPEYRPRPGQSFRHWLFAVLRNQGTDFRRRRATRVLPGPAGLETAHDDTPADRVADLDEHEYRLRLVRGALDVVAGDFDPPTVAAFTRVMIDGRPVPDVAAELGLSAGAVYMARNRVLSRLREHLDGLLD